MLLVAKGTRAGSHSRLRKMGLDAVEVDASPPMAKCACYSTEKSSRNPQRSAHDDAPVYKRPLERWEPPVPPKCRSTSSSLKFRSPAISNVFWPVLTSVDKRWIWQNTITWCKQHGRGPRASDGGVIRIKVRKRGLAMALDGNGRDYDRWACTAGEGRAQWAWRAAPRRLDAAHSVRCRRAPWRALLRTFNTNYAGIARPWALDRVGLHHVIVLLPYPALATMLGLARRRLRLAARSEFSAKLDVLRHFARHRRFPALQRDVYKLEHRR